jgi:hypothetical protein
MDKIQKDNPDLTFYYSREHRLAKAPESVRALYEKQPPKGGLFRSLTDTKGKQATLVSIVVLCVLILFLSFFTNAGVPKFEGSAITVSAIRMTEDGVSGTTYIVLKKEAVKNKDAFSGMVQIDVFAQENTLIAIWQSTVVFTEEAQEEFRFAIPGAAPQLLVTLSSEKETWSAQVKAE